MSRSLEIYSFLEKFIFHWESTLYTWSPLENLYSPTVVGSSRDVACPFLLKHI